jgi:cellulose synthase/poly-beta-1,6-N-acetylglucosamine synthase-like glycosyltransferase
VEQVIWFFHVHGTLDVLRSLAVPLHVGFALYQFDYAFLLLRYLVRASLGGDATPRGAIDAPPDALIVLPTLLRSEDEMWGLAKAIASAAENEYPGRLTIVASIDDAGGNPRLFAALETWMRAFPAPPGVRLLATGTPRRTGKAVAIDHAVRHVRAMVARGELEAEPTIFFNMDGDSALGPRALERMMRRLTAPGRVSGERPMIVTSNVCIDRDVYWRGWREYFTVRGQIAILVAREYLTSIAIGKFNSRLIPVQEASGALYCTWWELHEQAPRWAAFMQTLRFRDWLRWWLGAAPPSFAASTVAPLPEAQTGPGDDTWMTWLACCARWRGGAISLELPRTPVHALLSCIHGYLFRPVGYEPEARIVTKTPTTVRALFKQRVRWNSSRIQDLTRWRPALAYQLRLSIPTTISSVLLISVHTTVVASLLLWPFSVAKGGMVTAWVLALGLNFAVRALSTVIALVVDGTVRQSWRLLFGLPLSIPYHVVFNILPTIVGLVEDILLFGVNTHFSPEETYIRGRLTRIALAYRVRRALALAVRSILYNDVPLGAFWLGWHETPWTPNGFEGWTSGKRRVLLPREPGREP